MKIFSQSISILLASLLIAGQLPAQVSANLRIRVTDSDGTTAVAGSKTNKGFTVQVTDDAGNGISEAAVVFRLPESASTGVFSDGTHAAVAYTDQSGRANVSGIQWSPEAGVAGIKVTATKGTAHAGILVEETLTATAVEPVTTPSPVVATEVPKIPVSEPAPASKPVVPVRQPGTLEASSNLPSPTLNAQKASAEAAVPSVTVKNGPTGEKIHSGSKTKWIILAAVIAAGAGAGIAMAGKSKSSTSSTSTGVSIGSPTVSVGTP